MKKHFKFHLNDAKQLGVALTGAFSTWAATGFTRDLPHLGYVIVGFITGGLASHNMEDQYDSHIVTPTVGNVTTSTNADAPAPVTPLQGTDIKKLIKVSSNLIQ